MRVCRFVIFVFMSAAPVMAATRVFVSSTGMDTDGCPITAPCRSFSYAMTQVAAGGEIIALDTAGYGTFTVGQAVSVFAAPGATAFIAVPSGTGISVSAGPMDKIVLRNLALSGTGGTIGIDFPGGQSLSIENCIINGFSSIGVQMFRSGDTTDPNLAIENTTIRNNGAGVYTADFDPSARHNLSVAKSSISENGLGLDVSDTTHGAATDSVVSGNSNIGVQSWTGHDNTGPDFTLERCTIAQNGTGISAGFSMMVGGPSRGILRIAHNQIFGNNLGVYEYADGKIMTLTTNGIVTNTIEGNVTNGTFSGSYAAK